MRPVFSPDWIIIGARATAFGVEVYASVTVSDGECIARNHERVERVPGAISPVGGMLQSFTPDGYDVKVHVDRFITVQAHDYAEALRILGAMWKPPTSDWDPGNPPEQRSIEP